jgi:cellulase
MKKVDDALTDVGYGDGWFKVSEAGLNVASKIIKVKI